MALAGVGDEALRARGAGVTLAGAGDEALRARGAMGAAAIVGACDDALRRRSRWRVAVAGLDDACVEGAAVRAAFGAVLGVDFGDEAGAAAGATPGSAATGVAFGLCRSLASCARFAREVTTVAAAAVSARLTTLRMGRAMTALDSKAMPMQSGMITERSYSRLRGTPRRPQDTERARMLAQTVTPRALA